MIRRDSLRTLQNRFANMSFYSIAPFIKEFYPEYWGVYSYDATKCIRIHKVNDEWGILCNFANTPIVLGCFTFKSSEQLFQLMKFNDKDVVKRILNGVTRNDKKCHEVKKTVRSYEKDYRRKDWGSMVIDAMKFSLQCKYDQSEAFRQKLEATKGFYIVEDQTSFPKTCPDAWGVKFREGQFVGPNLLGRLLMELRDDGRLEYSLPDNAFDFIKYLE